MQKVRIPQNSFQYGEISDNTVMRTDSPIYAASAQSLENMIVLPEGAVKKRHGGKFHYKNTQTNKELYLAPFVFDDNEEYLIGIGEGYILCWRIIANNNLTLVSTITQDTEGNALPFDKEYLHQYNTAQSGDVMFICHPLFAPRTLVRTSLTDFELSKFAFDFRPDQTVTYQPYSKFQGLAYINPRASSGSGVKVALYTKTGIEDTNGIALEQDDTSSPFTISLNGALANNGTVTFDVAREVTITDTSGAVDDVFTIIGTDTDGAAKTITYQSAGNTTGFTGEYFKTITSITCSTAFSDVSIGVSDKEAAVGYFNITGSHNSNGNYASSAHKGVILRYGKAEMEITSVQSSNQCKVKIFDELKVRLSIINPLRTTDTSNEVEVTQIGHGFAGGESITIEDASAVGGINASNLNGTRSVASIIDENTYTIIAGSNANLSEDGGGLVKIVSHANTLNWDEQSWSGVRGYPAAITFHENRLCFGGTIAEPDTIWMSQLGRFFNFDLGDADDTDAINLVAATGDVNEIRYMNSSRDLQIFTLSDELYVPTYLNQAITPTNAQIRKQTPFGTEFVLPTSIDGATIFVERGGRSVREYIYSDSENAYVSTSVSTVASHTIVNPVDMAVVHSGFNTQESYVALTMENGDMALFSSNRAEKRAAWTKVTTQGDFLATASVGNKLFYYAKDINNNYVLSEFVDNIGLDNYLYVAYGNGTVSVSSLYSSGTVDVIGYDGTNKVYLGEFTVSGGNITMTSHNNYTHFYVGKKFTSKIITNPIDTVAGNGPVTGDLRGISTVVLNIKDSTSLKVNNRVINNITGFTGNKEVRLLGYNRNPQVTIEQDDPMPFQINGLISELII